MLSLMCKSSQTPPDLSVSMRSNHSLQIRSVSNQTIRLLASEKGATTLRWRRHWAPSDAMRFSPSRR